MPAGLGPRGDPLGKSSIDLTLVSEWNDGRVRRFEDCLAGEEPLEIRIGTRPLTVTMRTPGHDVELAAGFLLSEGVISRRAQLVALGHHARRDGRINRNRVDAELHGAAVPKGMRRNFAASSACGICGKARIEAVRPAAATPPDSSFRIDPAVLCGLPEKLRSAQPIFSRTGGLHAAAIFTRSGDLLVLREDIGRHNAVDKVIGWALLGAKLPLSGHILLVSGRGGFEIVQKALAAGVPALASVSAPSSLAVRLARQAGMVLVGFLRGARFVVYSGEERILQ